MIRFFRILVAAAFLTSIAATGAAAGVAGPSAAHQATATAVLQVTTAHEATAGEATTDEATTEDPTKGACIAADTEAGTEAGTGSMQMAAEGDEDCTKKCHKERVACRRDCTWKTCIQLCDSKFNECKNNCSD